MTLEWAVLTEVNKNHPRPKGCVINTSSKNLIALEKAIHFFFQNWELCLLNTKSEVESITFLSWGLKGKKRVVTQNNFPILTKSLTIKNELVKSSQGCWAIHNSEVQQAPCKGHCCSPSCPSSSVWLVQQTSACVGWRNTARQAHLF